MTLFDIIVPLFAILVAGAGVLIVRLTDRRDKRLHRAGRHPAE